MKVRGFTLIEVMIVIAILAIVAAVVIPAIANFISDEPLSDIPHNTLLQTTPAPKELNDLSECQVIHSTPTAKNVYLCPGDVVIVR